MDDWDNGYLYATIIILCLTIMFWFSHIIFTPIVIGIVCVVFLVGVGLALVSEKIPF